MCCQCVVLFGDRRHPYIAPVLRSLDKLDKQGSACSYPLCVVLAPAAASSESTRHPLVEEAVQLLAWVGRGGRRYPALVPVARLTAEDLSAALLDSKGRTGGRSSRHTASTVLLDFLSCVVTDQEAKRSKELLLT